MQYHLLVLGQSNVANHGVGEAVVAKGGGVWYGGTMRPLEDPILGGTGKGVSIWPRVVNGLLDNGIVSDVVVSLRAVGGAGSDEWCAGGKHFHALMNDTSSISACPTPVTHVIFHQGERDTLLNTDQQTYVQRIGSLIEAVSGTWSGTTWIMCRASYRMGVTNAAVIAAQNDLIARHAHCRPGPETDAFGAEYRCDNTHFNTRGLDAFAEEMRVALSVRA